MSKKPTPVVQKQDKNVVRGEAPARRNEEVYGMITRGWGAGAHRSRGREEQRGAPPKHKKDYRREEYMTSPTARFEEGEPADPTANMSPEDAAEWKKQNAIHRDEFTGGEAMMHPEARYEEGVSVDPTKNMSPEDAAEWKRQNEAHKDEFAKAAASPDDEKDYKTALRRLAVAKRALQRVPVRMAEELGFDIGGFDSSVHDKFYALGREATYATPDPDLVKQAEDYRTKLIGVLTALKDIGLVRGDSAFQAEYQKSVRALPTINQNMDSLGQVAAFATILRQAAVVAEQKAKRAASSVDYLTKWIAFYDANGRAPFYGEQQGWLRRASDDLASAWGRTLSREAKEKYPWDECIADQMKQYGDKETAEKVCGAIKAKSQGLGKKADDLISAWGSTLSRVADLSDETCWEGYEAYGFKEKDGQSVPNCLPVKKADDTSDQDRSPVMQRQAAHPLDRVRGHQLWPANVAKKVPPLYSQEKERDPIVWVKLFSPYTNAVWYITEYDPSSHEAFGWADLGMGGGELGYISIRELEGLNRKGLPLVERDLYWKPVPLSRAKTSRMASEDRTAKFPKGVEMTVDEVAKVVGPEFKEMNENPPDSVVSLREEMTGGKEASADPLVAAWGNLMVVVADEGSPEADKAELKKDADPASKDQNLASTWEKVDGSKQAAEGSPEADKTELAKDADPASHDQNLASTWEKVAGGSGAANAAFLRRSPLKDKILRAVAKHYGTSVSEIEDELTDPDAEALYEYIGNDPALRMQVYREFKW